MNSLRKLQPVVMSIAGSDSGAGAGVQADIKTCAALGVFCTTVVTAITAQNTCRLMTAQAVAKTLVGAQFDALVEDFNIAAIKIGMLGSAETLEYLAHRLVEYKIQNPDISIILDTPLRASVGCDLLDPTDQKRLWQLIPIADLVTPNLAEAAVLLESSLAQSRVEMAAQAQKFIDYGAQAVLLKGGHLVADEAADCLVDSAGNITWFTGPRIFAPNNHGTGCTLASAIAARRALGDGLPEAIAQAKAFVRTLLENSQSRQFGLGVGPLVCFNL